MHRDAAFLPSADEVRAAQPADIARLYDWLHRVERCDGCGREVTVHICHCGETRTMHPPDHGFVPMGCDCHRDDGCGEEDAQW